MIVKYYVYLYDCNKNVDEIFELIEWMSHEALKTIIKNMQLRRGSVEIKIFFLYIKSFEHLLIKCQFNLLIISFVYIFLYPMVLYSICRENLIIVSIKFD